MNFSHLIEINDPGNPLIEPLTRTQLWQGLCLRAERPTVYLAHLDRCEITGRLADGFARSLHYGAVVVHDTVRLMPPDEIRILVPAQGEIKASSLCIRIEEPEPERFFLRFSYSDAQTEEEDQANAMFDEFRRSAYLEADIDMVREMRRLAADGLLDAPIV